jgi:hypothetical protein
MNEQHMERDVFWTPWDTPGLEHLRLVQYEGGILADGVIIGVEEGRPFRVRYTIQCDRRWCVREVRLDLLDDTNRRLDLMSDGDGHWTDGAGEPLLGLVGCFDIDIAITPFTNTLPIRRLALPPSAAADINVAYIALPNLDGEPSELIAQPQLQRYTCLAANVRSGRYHFESRDSGFSAELPVDADGLVIDYPGLFRRVTVG